jgi:hypothetical protein
VETVARKYKYQCQLDNRHPVEFVKGNVNMGRMQILFILMVKLVMQKVLNIQFRSQ